MAERFTEITKKQKRKSGIGYVKTQYAKNELSFESVSLKTGIKPFYTIISTGIQFDSKDDFLIAYTYGIGTFIPITKSIRFNPEITLSQVNDNAFWSPRVNLVNQLHLNLTKKISEKIDFSIGSKFNIFIKQPLENGEIGTLHTEESIYYNLYGTTTTKIWTDVKLILWF